MKKLSVDEKIDLAEKIFEEVKDLNFNEWRKWVAYLSTHNLDDARTLAEKIAKLNSDSLYEKISRLFESKSLNLTNYDTDTILEVFGYVSWLIKIKQKEGKRRNNLSQTRIPTHSNPLYRSQNFKYKR